MPSAPSGSVRHRAQRRRSRRQSWRRRPRVCPGSWPKHARQGPSCSTWSWPRPAARPRMPTSWCTPSRARRALRYGCSPVKRRHVWPSRVRLRGRSPPEQSRSATSAEDRPRWPSERLRVGWPGCARSISVRSGSARAFRAATRPGRPRLPRYALRPGSPSCSSSRRFAEAIAVGGTARPQEAGLGRSLGPDEPGRRSAAAAQRVSARVGGASRHRSLAGVRASRRRGDPRRAPTAARRAPRGRAGRVARGFRCSSCWTVCPQLMPAAGGSARGESARRARRAPRQSFSCTCGRGR